VPLRRHFPSTAAAILLVISQRTQTDIVAGIHLPVVSLVYRYPSHLHNNQKPMNATETSKQSNHETQPAKVLYTAKAHTTGGREGGASRTSDGRLDVKFSLPGAPGHGTNPEQLFATGWSACFLSALKIVASQKKLALPADTTIDAEVDLCTDAGGYFLKARLNVSLPSVGHEIAQAVVEAADQTCPYSKATRGNISVEINLV
jgi:Ohr subfamily peroxiredoxin